MTRNKTKEEIEELIERLCIVVGMAIVLCVAASYLARREEQTPRFPTTIVSESLPLR